MDDLLLTHTTVSPEDSNKSGEINHWKCTHSYYCSDHKSLGEAIYINDYC